MNTADDARERDINAYAERANMALGELRDAGDDEEARLNAARVLVLASRLLRKSMRPLGAELTPDKTTAYDVIQSVQQTPNGQNVAIRIKGRETPEGYQRGAFVLLTRAEAFDLIAELREQIR